MCNQKYFFLPFGIGSTNCHSIEVTAGSSTTNGIYEPSDKRPVADADNLVWKKPTADRFIFNTGGSYGWRIADQDSLLDGTSWYQSKRLLKYVIRSGIYLYHLILFITCR